MAEKDPLMEFFSAAKRIGSGPGGNIPLNAAISSYLDTQKARRGQKRLQDVTRLLAQAEPGTLPGLEGEASELATMALGPEAGLGVANQFAAGRGQRATERRQAEAMGRYLGFSNPGIQEGAPSFNIDLTNRSVDKVRNFSNTGAQSGPTLTDFMAAPQQIFEAETTRRANEQALLKEQTKAALQQQRQIAVERFKASTKNKKPTSLKDLTPNEIKQMMGAVGTEITDPREAFEMIYGDDIPVGAKAKESDLTPEEQELLNKYKGR